MNASELRFGLVGAGAIAQTYAQIFRENGCGRIIGVADVRREAAAAVAEVLGCAHYGAAEHLAQAQQLDAVIICTPPSTHASLCELFLDRGVHVLCEKPLTVDTATAHRMLSAARRAGRTLAMAAKFRYVADVVHARSLLMSGLLGETGVMRVLFRTAVDMARRWNSDRTVSGGGVLIDNGTHAVDLVRYLLGPVREVFATEAERIQRLDVEETVHMILRTAGGAIATIELSWSMADVALDFVQLSCSRGGLSIGWKESGYRLLPQSDWIPFGKGYSKMEAIRQQTENFARAVAGQEQLLISEADQLASVEVIAAAYRSLASGAWEPLEDAVAVGAVGERA